MRAITLDRTQVRPIAQQIAAELRRRIVSGEAPPGFRLPPSRRLAQDLNIARATVVEAYEQLIAEGYVIAKQGAGSFVAETATGLSRRRGSSRARAVRSAPAPSLFRPGAPDMRLFPYEAWARIASRAVRLWPQSTVVASEPFGDLELRAAIAQHLAEWRGVVAAPDQIVITAGSGNGLEISIAALAEKGRPIALETPGYPELRRFVMARGFAIEDLAVGPDGAATPSAEAGLAVLTPSHQYPLGGAMPLKRRIAFLNWADRADAWIIEDDYDSEFRYGGAPIPALSGLAVDRMGENSRVLYLGSFSKVFSAELRLGFLVLPRSLIEPAAAALFAAGAKASIMPQRALARFIMEGQFHKHIRRVRRFYAERRAALVSALGPELARRIVHPGHPAGMHLTLALRDGFAESAALSEASKRGLGLRGLSECGPSGGAAGLRLGYCAHTPEEIAAGAEDLRLAIGAGEASGS